jgi:hypothetical protein
MSRYQMHDFVTRPALLRKAIEARQQWIEQQLGVAIGDAVIFEVRVNLAQIAIEKVLRCSISQDLSSREMRRLRPLVVSAEVPLGFPPLLRFNKAQSKNDLRTVLFGPRKPVRPDLA